jgi:hypothetical protein
VEGNELLIFTQQIGEKAEILRREEGRADNEEGKGTEESEMGDREAVKAEDKPEEEGRGKEPEMGDGEAVGPEDKPQEDQTSKEPEIGGPEPLKSEGSKEGSGKEGGSTGRDMLVGFLKALKTLSFGSHVSFCEELMVQCS